MFYSLVSAWTLALILNIFLFKTRTKFLAKQTETKVFMSAGIIKNIFYNGQKYAKSLFWIAFLGVFALFIPFISTSTALLIALTLFIVPSLLIELLVPKIYRYDFVLTAWISAFFFSILLGAGLFLILGEIFFQETLFLSDSTAAADALSTIPFNENLFITVIVGILTIILLNTFWLIRALASTYLNRFQFQYDSKKSLLKLINRFNKSLIAEIDFTKDYTFETAYDYNYSFIGGLPSRTKTSVFVFKQNEHCLALIGPFNLNQDTPLVANSETYIYNSPLIKDSTYAYEFYLYEDKFFEFAKMINKYKK